MDWEKIGNLGLPGLMIVVIYAIAKIWIVSSEKVQLERVKVEDKRADAMVGALTSLSGKIDTHHTNDLQSHQEMAEGIAEIHGKLDQALIDRTPVEGVPLQRRDTPPRGVPIEAGYYPPSRPKTGGR